IEKLYLSFEEALQQPIKFLQSILSYGVALKLACESWQVEYTDDLALSVTNVLLLRSPFFHVEMQTISDSSLELYAHVINLLRTHEFIEPQIKSVSLYKKFIAHRPVEANALLNTCTDTPLQVAKLLNILFFFVLNQNKALDKIKQFGETIQDTPIAAT